jgi:hypothetical protein
MLAVFSTAYSEQAEYDEFAQGYYITDKDKKIQGWLRYVKGVGARVEYKALEDDRIKKLSAFSCKEFVMREDIRFVRVPRRVIVRVGGLNRTLVYDFLRVFEEGKINLYMHYTELESKTKKDFTPENVDIPIIRKGDSEMVPLSGNDNKTLESLEELFSGDKKAMKALTSGNWDEILKFVQEYNRK